jgi:hypothetical protein
VVRSVETKGVVFEQGALGPGREQGGALHGVALVAQDLTRVPVVPHLVVVPLHQDRHLRAEAPLVLVEEVVGEVPAVVGEALRHPGLGGRGHVLPDGAVLEPDLGRDGPVRVDLIAGVDEEVRVAAAHELVHLHPAPVGIDAPALPDLVPRPGEGDGPPAQGRRAESPGRGCAQHLGIGEVLEQNAVEDVLPGGQSAEVHPRGEIGFGQRGGPDDPPDVSECFRRGVLDDEPRGTVGPAPDDGSVAGDVIALDPAGDGRTQSIRRHHRGRLGLRPDRPPRRPERGRAQRQQRALKETSSPPDRGTESLG